MPIAMIKEFAISALRSVMFFVSGVAVTAGFGTSDMWTSITAGVLSLATAVFWYFSKKRKLTNEQIDGGVA